MSGSFIGNMSALDQAAGISLVGSSRVVEIPYVSSPAGEFVGNFSAVAQLLLSLGTGSRVVEIEYESYSGS